MTAPIRHAATLIVLRDRDETPKVLMGQRGAKAAFMPNKFVFPGGAVDKSDANVPAARPLSKTCHDRLLEDPTPGMESIGPQTLAAAGIRELFEETGQILAQPGAWQDTPAESWRPFSRNGLPDLGAMQFVFRALTPPGRPRRFDARFFLVDAEDLASDPDDFSSASDELSHLTWVPLEEARKYDMPFITEVVLSEVQARVTDRAAPASVPFFRNNDEASLFRRLYGQDPVK